MSGSQLAVFTPMAADLPPNVDVDTIVADLRDDHVAAPAKDHDGLVDVVARAKSEGIDLNIVVIGANPRHDSQLRDLATEVGKQESGTVVVLSKDWVGTYSNTISRVNLEAAEDPAKNTGGNSTLAATKFVDRLTEPGLPWGALTAVLFAATIVATGGLYWIKARRARAEKATEPSDS